MKLSFLYGSDLGTLLRLFWQQRFQIKLTAIPSLLLFFFLGITNTLLGLPERFRSFKSDPVKPVFILGHWRSGTSHLHNLMTADKAYYAPTVFQVAFPHIFFYWEKWLEPLLEMINPGVRPMDAMEMRMSSVYEEEVALAALGAPSPYLAVHFPKGRQKYQAFLSFRNAAEGDLSEWEEKYKRFLRKIVAKYGQDNTLILKSPANTARIPLLLNMYPDARFIHIHRNPYETIRSTMHLYDVWFEMNSFQSMEGFRSERDESVLKVFEELYRCWFEDRELIPKDNLMTLGFEELKDNPVKIIENIYQFLGDAKPDKAALEKYLASIASYQQNKYDELSPEITQYINQQLAFVFEGLGYSMRMSSSKDDA